MTYTITKEFLEKVEKELFDEKTASGKPLVLLINTINGTQVEALFTSHDKAVLYMIRVAINFVIDTYDEMREEMKDETPKFDDRVKEHIRDYYKFIPVCHLDPSKPVYQGQSGNYRVYGEPTDYLTNSVEIWTEKQHDPMVDDWLEQCTVKVNPALPEFESCDDAAN